MSKCYMKGIHEAIRAGDMRRFDKLNEEALNYYAAPIVAMANNTVAADYPLMLAGMRLAINAIYNNYNCAEGKQLIEEIETKVNALCISMPKR